MILLGLPFGQMHCNILIGNLALLLLRCYSLKKVDYHRQTQDD
jgi:hypothetical protein